MFNADGARLVELGLIAAPTPIASTLGRRDFFGHASVLRNATPERASYPRRRSGPSPEEMAEAAQLFADAAAGRNAYHREYAAAL